MNVIINYLKEKYYYCKFLQAARNLRIAVEKENKQKYGSICLADLFYGMGVGRK